MKKRLLHEEFLDLIPGDLARVATDYADVYVDNDPNSIEITSTLRKHDVVLIISVFTMPKSGSKWTCVVGSKVDVVGWVSTWTLSKIEL